MPGPTDISNSIDPEVSCASQSATAELAATKSNQLSECADEKKAAQPADEANGGLAEELAAGREILQAEMLLRAEHQAAVNRLMQRQAEKQERYQQLLEVLRKSSVYAKLIVDRIEEEKKTFDRRLARAERHHREGAAATESAQAPAEPAASVESESAESETPAEKAEKAEVEEAEPPRTRRSQRVSRASQSSSAAVASSKKRSRPADETESSAAARSTKRHRQADDDKSSNPIAEPELKEEPQAEVEPDAEAELDDAGRLDLFTGQLRDYQLEGFNWLRRMYENGINGILGDEMGLGKTVQCIAFIAHLVRMGVTGPYFVVGPLSTLCNWRSEFARFAPAVPVVLYHGSKDRCAQLRNQLRAPASVPGCATRCSPVVITSYEMAIRDRSVFQRYQWKLLIVDEGHRVKNFQCRLARELRMYHCTHRLILTGTPIQNNLTELWSLLNFLLPEIFEKLGTFEAWFDAGVLQDAEAKRRLLEQEEEQRVLSAMQQILLPFMLRRCKADVDLEVPPKREQLLYAPMAPEQAALYRMAVDRTIEKFVGGGESGLTSSSSSSSFEAVAAAAAAAGPRQAKLRAGRLARQMVQMDETSQSSDGKQYDDDDEGDVVDENDEGEGRGRAARATGADAILSVADLDAALGVGGSGSFQESAELHVSLRNPMALLKRICNHPYLVRYPLTPDGQYRVDEELVRVSGKFRLLDRLLPELQRQGHKVLIFSQWVCILDLLQDYCHLRGYKFCRLDGSTSLENRDSEISRFYKEADTGVFLVTTRAGGLGLNLTPADTVIIFDSDWNPQADLQAQDRCHRIGQSVPVLVFRLVTANSIDERVVSRADAKRTLERMIISRSRFRKSLTREALEQAKKLDRRELEDLLLTEAAPAMGSKADSGDDDNILPDDELAKLLDRSELMADWERLRAERRAKDAATAAAVAASVPAE